MRKIETRRIMGKLLLIVLLVAASAYSTVAVRAQPDCRGECNVAYAECQFNCRGLPSGVEQTACLLVCATTNTVCLAQCGL
jgi:hypothetical protein